MSNLLRNSQAALALLALHPLLGAGGEARAAFLAVGEEAEARADWAGVRAGLIQGRQEASKPSPSSGMGRESAPEPPVAPLPLPARRQDAAPASTGDAPAEHPDRTNPDRTSPASSPRASRLIRTRSARSTAARARRRGPP